MKKKVRKLSLNKDTLRTLEGNRLGDIGGAVITDTCPETVTCADTCPRTCIDTCGAPCRP